MPPRDQKQALCFSNVLPDLHYCLKDQIALMGFEFSGNVDHLTSDHEICDLQSLSPLLLQEIIIGRFVCPAWCLGRGIPSIVV